MAVTNATLALMGWELPTLQQLPVSDFTATDAALVALAGYVSGLSLPETPSDDVSVTVLSGGFDTVGDVHMRPGINAHL